MSKLRFSWWAAVALLSLILNGALLYTFLIAGKTEQNAEAADPRTAIILNDDERALVLTEMRAFLSAVQTMNTALAAGDLAQVEKSALSVGQAAAQTVPPALMAKLPMQFKQLGLSTHQGFDQLAMDARDLGDSQHTLQQLGQLMNNCVACHATFQLRALPVKTQ
ncbi:MAG TPA: hypothetical protein VGE50_11160 [Gammaproteobacteria bacterium]